ncbi:hypothetical protein PPYR_04454 [Photinus pyralis]|uniref:N-acetyltransferase domain-containing protein n=2 Tax=Photinus pyralis TaxID=7054 RepID=A0A5N4AYE5_PHOPY|nr:diamine acetyltransferase 2-like [Photinus pyralis]KAB0802268.1 hypothetical protein PPYR_04454 [Photinus pyralis]
MSNSVIIREAKKEDMHQVCQLIKDLAVFENCEDQCKMTPELLMEDGFDTENPLFKSFVADRNNQVIGYAIYFNSYSTWLGKSTFLEDLYVDSKYRGQGIGRKLFLSVAKVAKQNKSKRLDLHCLAWNPALEFYKKIGATNITESESWNYVRINGCDLDKLFD